jgi:hypothetical protein
VREIESRGFGAFDARHDSPYLRGRGAIEGVQMTDYMEVTEREHAFWCGLFSGIAAGVFLTLWIVGLV